MQFPLFPANHKAKIYAERSIVISFKVQFIQRSLSKYIKCIQVQAIAGSMEWRTPAPSKECTSHKDAVLHAEKLCSGTCLKWVTNDRRLPEAHRGHADFRENNCERWARISALGRPAQVQHFSEESEICDLPRNNKVIVVSS